MKWGVIGCGKLAQAIIEGALQNNLISRKNIFFTVRTQKSASHVKKKLGITRVKNNTDLLECCDWVFLAVKPQNILNVLKEIGPHIRKYHRVVCLAAGTSSILLKKHLKNSKCLVRVMSNTPVVIKRGYFGVYVVFGDSKDRQEVKRIFSRLGMFHLLGSDKDVDVVTAAAASGVGFVFYFMEAFEQWLCSHGFSRSHARELVEQVFEGAACLARSKANLSLSDLKKAVASKKGTTLAGINAFNRFQVALGLKSGLTAAYKRSIELSKSLLNESK